MIGSRGQSVEARQREKESVEDRELRGGIQ